MRFSILVSKKLLPCGCCETIKHLLYRFLVMSSSFPVKSALHPFSRFFVGNRLKKSQNMPFWQCYSISSYWFVCIRFSVFLHKTLKRQVLSDFVLVFGLVHNCPKKKLKWTFLIIFFCSYNFPEFSQNFGNSVPMKMKK